MRRLVIGLLASTALVGTASAADIAYKSPPVMAPVYAYNWTGFYVGGHLGYGWGDSKVSYNDYYYDYDYYSYDYGSHDFDGFLGGLQIGFDYQFANNVVFGIQGDISWTDFEGKHAYYEDYDYYGYNGVFHHKADWLASLTARLGFAADRALFYVKGGAAWTKLKHTDSYVYWEDDYADEYYSDYDDKTRSGWTVGVGVEYAFAPNWTVFAEYNYYDFGKNHVKFDYGYYDYYETYKIDTDLSVVKFGINYRFGGPGPSAVAARY